MYKVRVIKHVYKLNKDDKGKVVSRYLHDTFLYNVTSNESTKIKAKKYLDLDSLELPSVDEQTGDDYSGDDYKVILSTGKVWDCEDELAGVVTVPQEHSLNMS